MLRPLEGRIGEPDERTRVVCPPYRTIHSLTDALGPSILCPGAVLVDEASNPLVGLARLTAQIQQRPWLIPCLVISSDQDPLEPLLLLVSELRDRLAVVRMPSTASYPNASEIVEAVRNRKPPDAEALAGWVGYRLKSRELSSALAAQFRHALGGPPASTYASAATFSRLFARFGRLTARDWRAIARLAVDGAWTQQPTAPRLGFRTLLQYLKKYVRPKSRTIDRVGWEWVLESVLRSAGYVSEF